MKQLITILTIFITTVSYAQNVGIGTSIPTKPLTVVSNGIGLSQESSTGAAKIGFYTSGTNAYLQTHNAVDLKFATNDSTFSMILKRGSGNLGVGQANPTAKLDVNGTIKITDGTQGDGKVLTSDAAGNGTWANQAYGNTERFRFALSSFFGGSTSLQTNYNFGTASTTYTAGNDNLLINITKSGLYHFDINAHQNSTSNYSNNGADPRIMNVVIGFSGGDFNRGFSPFYRTAISVPDTYSSYDKSYEIYITAPVSMYFSCPKVDNNSLYRLNIVGHLISE